MVQTHASCNVMQLVCSYSLHSETPPGENQIFSPDSRCVLTYGSSQTGLCNKVWPEVRSVKYSKLLTKANSKFHLLMKTTRNRYSVLLHKLCFQSPIWDDPYVGTHRERGEKSFGFYLVVFRCVQEGARAGSGSNRIALPDKSACSSYWRG